MSYINLLKSKNFRIWYFIFLVCSLIGMLVCFFIYKYTDYFQNDKFGVSNFSLLSKSDLFKRYACEISGLGIIFLLGFTVFSLIGCVIFSVYRGFMCGFSSLTLAVLYKGGEIDLFHCIFILICTSIIPSLEICICANARLYSMSLEACVPSLLKTLSYTRTHKYLASFLFISFFIFVFTFIINIL